ncbi:MAG TPA: vWA domain-containing protein [Ktedonobacteraceae bacterium]|nr:vWA domain-containing protein [Ktedonobacteraceae bacterium]
MVTVKYTQPATRLTPALVIYLIDASSSMNEPCGSTTKIALVNMALEEAVKGMVLRSMRDVKVQPRYHIAMFAYSTKVNDLLNGIRTLPELLRVGGSPELIAGGTETDSASGFMAVEDLLKQHLATYKNGPAPLVCHLTDGLFTTQDPAPIIQRIRAMSVEDGEVLVENILMIDKMLRKPPKEWSTWGGVQKARDLTNDYAKHLFALSSPLPETYRQNINRSAGYDLQKGVALFFPGIHPKLVQLALAASSATQM